MTLLVLTGFDFHSPLAVEFFVPFLCRFPLFTGKGVGVGAHHGVRPHV